MSASGGTSSRPGSGGGGGGGSNNSGGGGGGPCGACKFLRRKCVAGCIFAPYFDSEQGAAHFAAVHKVFGASNVSKLLLHIPAHKRVDAVVTICYEAQARLRDPVYGCVAHIFALQQQVVNLQAELAYLQAHLATLELPSPPPQPPPLPNLISPPASYDLSSLFDPVLQPPWAAAHQRQNDPRHFAASANPTEIPCSSSSDLQELARELFNRNNSPPEAGAPATANEGSSSSPHFSK